MFSNNAFDGVITFTIVGILSIPLAIWKLVDIIIWVFTHVDIGFK